MSHSDDGIGSNSLVCPAKNMVRRVLALPQPHTPCYARQRSAQLDQVAGVPPPPSKREQTHTGTTGASSSAARATSALLGRPPRSCKGATALPRFAGPAGASGAPPGRGAQTFPGQRDRCESCRGKDWVAVPLGRLGGTRCRPVAQRRWSEVFDRARVPQSDVVTWKPCLKLLAQARSHKSSKIRATHA